MSFRESVNRPLYSFDYENDTSLLKWLNDLYLFRSSDAEEVSRIFKQTNQLALWLNYSPVNRRTYDITSSGAFRVFEKREYYGLYDPMTKPIIDSWVGRLTNRKPSFAVLPKKYDDPSVKFKADKAKAILESKFQEQLSNEMDEMSVRNSFIFGESYLEIKWNKDIGPLDKDVEEFLDDAKNKDKSTQSFEQIRIGDIEFKLHDPRNVIVQRASSYREAEWVLLLELYSTEKLKLMYPELEDRITHSTVSRVFSHDLLSPTSELGRTMVFKFYHRPTVDMPEGYIVEATQEVILSRGTFPSNRWIKEARFPVLQACDVAVLGSSRGMSSTVMDIIVESQIALSNLWRQAITSYMLYAPKLLVAKNSLDMNQLRVGERNVVTYSKTAPEIMAQEVVSQNHLLLIDKLRDRIMKASNVMPVTRGDSMPNVESRQMLDWVSDQQNNQSIPKDVQHNRFLKEWATMAFELMSDMYENDQQERNIQYFGSLKKYNRASITSEDLRVDIDIYIDNISSFSGTLEGRLQKIQQILQVLPNYYSPAELVDILEIGAADKVIDEVTNAIESASKEVNDILGGKDTPAPTRNRDLFAYYDVYVQTMQKPDVQVLLPEVYDNRKTDIGTKLLNQLAAYEMLIFEMLDDKGTEQPTPQGPVMIPKGDMPIFAPKLGLPENVTYRQYLYGRHPEFPRVYKPDSLIPIDPFNAPSPGAPFPGAEQMMPMPAGLLPNPSPQGMM